MAGVVVDEFFYRIRADSTELERSLANSQRQFDKTISFIKDKPLIAFAGVSTALAGIGYQATQMAGEVDAAFKQTVAVMPAAKAGLAGIKQEVRDLSLESGRSQADLARFTKQIADGGVESAQDIKTLLRAGVTAADAAGADLGRILQGLDKISDEFALSADASADGVAHIFAAAQNKTNLVEVLDVLEKTTPSVHRLGLDLNTTSDAIVTLLAKGLTTKQVSAEFDRLAQKGAAGRKEIEALAKQSHVAGDAMQIMQAAAATSRESADKLSAILKQNLNAELIDLGNAILPTAIGLLRDFDQTLSVINGTAKRIALDSAVVQIENLAHALGKLNDEQVKRAIPDLVNSMAQVAGLPSAIKFEEIQKGGLAFRGLLGGLSQQIKDMPTHQLEAMYEGLKHLADFAAKEKSSMDAFSLTLGRFALELLSSTLGS